MFSLTINVLEKPLELQQRDLQLYTPPMDGNHLTC